MKVLPKLKNQRRLLKFDKRIEGICPKCGEYIVVDQCDKDIIGQGFVFCRRCGQKIDITEED